MIVFELGILKVGADHLTFPKKLLDVDLCIVGLDVVVIT